MSKTGKSTGSLVRVLALALVFTWAACDNAEELSDAELIVGEWNLSGLTDGSGDRLVSFNQNYTSFTGTFAADNTTTIVLVSATTAPDVDISATYTIDEDNGSVGITTSVGGIPLTIPFTYSFMDDDTLVLTASAFALGQVLQTTLTGTAAVTLSRNP